MAQIKPWLPLSNKKLRTIGLSSAKARAESFFIRELNGAREKNGLWMGLVHFFIREDLTPNYNSTLLSLRWSLEKPLAKVLVLLGRTVTSPCLYRECELILAGGSSYAPGS